MELHFDLTRLDADGNRINTATDTWRFLEDYLAQQKRVLLQQLCKSGLEHPKTEYVRGQLHLIERIVALGRPASPLADDPHE